MSASETQPSPSPSSPSSGQPTLYTRLISRHFRRDNAHIWLPLSVAVPLSLFTRYGPFIARRIPRFAASEYAKESGTAKATARFELIDDSMVWLALYMVVRDRQYDERLEADDDLKTIWRARECLRFPNESALYALFRERSTKTPATSVSSGTATRNSETSEGIVELAAMSLSWLLVPSTNDQIIRAALEEEMRRKNISQHDIDVTVSYLAGGMEADKYRFAAFLGVFAIPAVLVLDHFEKLGRWKPVMPALLVPLFVNEFQSRWLSMHVRDKPAVAAILKEKLSIS